jgi:hypothetical protein
MAMNKLDQPVFYSAFDQSVIQKAGVPGEFFTAFELTVQAKENDEIVVYFWNPERIKVRTGTLKVYLTK